MGGDTSRYRLYVSDDPDKMRANVREHYERTVLRLQDEIERMLKMYSWARECFEKEMFEGMGYKQLTMSEKDVKKLKELTVGLNSLVEARIKWDRAQKALAAAMTPAEEKEAVITFIASLPGDEQNDLRTRLSNRGIWPWKS